VQIGWFWTVAAIKDALADELRKPDAAAHLIYPLGMVSCGAAGWVLFKEKK